MYLALYQKLKRDQPPFHQKVLRMNYEIPVGQVYQAASRCFQAVGARGTLLLAPDFLECEIPVTQELFSVSREHFYQAVFAHVIPMGQRYPGARTGVFDGSGAWYLRLYAEDPADVSRGSFLCGNFELYAPDEALKAAEQFIGKTVEGHLITEGAKKYLEEIMEV